MMTNTIFANKTNKNVQWDKNKLGSIYKYATRINKISQYNEQEIPNRMREYESKLIN